MDCAEVDGFWGEDSDSRNSMNSRDRELGDCVCGGGGIVTESVIILFHLFHNIVTSREDITLGCDGMGVVLHRPVNQPPSL